MKNWMYVFIFILIISMLGSVIFYDAKKINDIESDIVSISEKKSEEVINSENWWTYENEKYGFTMKLPGDSKKWIIEENEYTKENCPFCGYEKISIEFNYVLDKPLREDESLKDMILWYVTIVPIDGYSDDLCLGSGVPCRQGKILGQNDKHVFLSGFTNIEGAGYACLDFPEKLKNFCRVDKNFGLENINSLIDFKIVNERDSINKNKEL